MDNFSIWLHKLDSNDQHTQALKSLAEHNAAQWPFYSDKLQDYENAVKNMVTDDDKDGVQNKLVELHSKWKTKQGSFLHFDWGKIAMLVFSAVLLGALIYAFAQPGFMSALAKPEGARALITLLFSVAVVAVALLSAVAIFWTKVDDLEERFSKAKDLLTILVGIFGTILGFYFGQAVSDNT